LRQRAFIHVAGSAGAGKTAFIEALLRSLGDDVICVRAVADDSLRSPRETRPQSHPELRRYRQKGASAVALYRFSPTEITATDAFFMTNFMENYSIAVVIEGDSPLEFADLTVFVARPLPEGGSLFRCVKRDHAAARAAALKVWEQALASSQAMAQFLQLNSGDPVLEGALSNPRIFELGRPRLAANLAKLRAAPSPKPTEHWALAPGYEGIERAGLVVGNVHGDNEQPQAELFLRDVARLRKDETVFQDVIGWRGCRVPVTAVVENLTDPQDAGLKKALARVKRAVRSAQ
jgi:molybdopterin-guanine dinucleotide biosynthesis protein